MSEVGSKETPLLLSGPPLNKKMKRPYIDRTNKRCGKQGHKSKGAAEAHLRALVKSQEFKPDWKYKVPVGVYYCIARSCRESPWHVGHNRHVTSER